MNKSLTSLVIGFAAVVNGLFAYLAIGQGMSYLSDEGNLLESLQAAFLALGGLTFLAVAFLAEKRFRLVFLSCFLLCLTFLLREVDVQQYQLPRVLILLASGMGRNLILLTAWAAVLLGVAIDFKAEVRTLRLCLLSQPGIFMMAGGVFVISGSIFDMQVFSMRHYAFYEELAEMDGYFLILQSAAAAGCNLKSSSISDPQPLAPYPT